MYDFLIVGAGLYGSVIAFEMKKRGMNVLVIDKRSHIGGNCYTENIEGVDVHKYGAHIFHTSDKEVWSYVNELVEFNRYTNSPIAVWKSHVYNLPFNMNTFHQLWGVTTPEEAMLRIDEQRSEMAGREPTNLEEQAISLIGRDVYERLIKGYTEKQWGRKCTDLPPFIIKRLPVRFTYDNNYFNDRYQGIPIDGYTQLFEVLLNDVEVKLNVCNSKGIQGINHNESDLRGELVWSSLIRKLIVSLEKYPMEFYGKPPSKLQWLLYVSGY